MVPDEVTGEFKKMGNPTAVTATAYFFCFVRHDDDDDDGRREFIS